MLTIEELNKIRDKMKDIVSMRDEGAENKSGYKYQVLVCGGTGCHSSGSQKVLDVLNEQIAAHQLEKEVKVVRTGCFGLCSLGPIMIVYPEGAFYARVQPEAIPEIVEEHLIKGNMV